MELDCRATFRDSLTTRFPDWAARLGPDHMLDLSVLGAVSETALTRQTEITMEASGLPSTFVPGRNLLFFTFAAALAYRRDLKHITGDAPPTRPHRHRHPWGTGAGRARRANCERRGGSGLWQGLGQVLDHRERVV